MLQTLSIRHFAIIDRLQIALGPGLNILTGETGAGKSIIIDALNTILGARAGADLVRAGADRAAIDAEFDIAGSPNVRAFLEERGFEAEDDLLLLSREISAAGKSTVRIGGRPATVSQLREIGEWLVDLHGQHEHQSLLSVPRHLEILDEWGGKGVLALRAESGEAHAEVRRLERERADLERDARERAHLIDLYTFQAQEIADANLVPAEEEELQNDSRRLANAQKLAEAAEATATALSSDSGGLLDDLATAVRQLEEAAKIDDTLSPLLETINSARYELEEAEHDLVRYRDGIEFNPERLEQVEDRLELIRNLKRKYGETIADVIAYGTEVADKLDALTHSEERGQALDGAIRRAKQRQSDLCSKLTATRNKVAAQFSEAVLSELRDLAMEKTRFVVQIEPAEPTSRGADHVEFVIAPNPGEPLRPLSRIASGGEISRVMLAIKSAAARQDPLPTMVFDEIDVGVGGRTSTTLADKLSALSATAQILCITHLPQIASRGQHHFLIEKRADDEHTVVSISPLSASERVAEIARMLGGSDQSDAALQHAKEMLRL